MASDGRSWRCNPAALSGGSSGSIPRLPVRARSDFVQSRGWQNEGDARCSCSFASFPHACPVSPSAALTGRRLRAIFVDVGPSCRLGKKQRAQSLSLEAAVTFCWASGSSIGDCILARSLLSAALCQDFH